MKSQSGKWFLAVFALAAASLLLSLVGLPESAFPKAQPAAPDELFMPLTQGTYWVYRGTVEWADPGTDKTTTANVSLTSKVGRVFQKPELTIAVISGFPSDLDWATGQVEPKPSLLIETKKHEVFVDPLPPDFDYAKLEKDTTALEKLLSEDNLLFRWPLKKGMKFGDAESLKREDSDYCWVVAEELRKSLSEIKGVKAGQAGVFVLRFVTNPDDTEIELSPGIGVISYNYHHHGTTADTSLTLVEFHSGL